MADIFISYERDDRDRVKPLAKVLENEGWSVFWDRTIPVGKSWSKVIREELDLAKCITAVWTKNSIESKWVLAEVDEGFEREILTPILLEDVNIPFPYKQIQAANLSDWEGDEFHTGFERLIRALTSIIGNPEQKKAMELIESAEQELSKPAKKFTNNIGMEFVFIPAGSFTMGTDQDYERPLHKVKNSQSFYLQTTQVTQGQWQELMGDNPSEFKDCGDDCPVEMVSWDDVKDFIKTLNEKDKTDKYRLPTEAEWEYACRAGTTTEYSFGADGGHLGEYRFVNRKRD